MATYDPSKRLEFSKESFATGVNTLGLPRFTELVTKKAAERQGADFTYQGIKDQFNLPDEQILTLFTNVRDFGKFDQEESFLSPGMQAGLEGAAREAPGAIAGGLGFAGGVRAAMPLASKIPGVGIPGLLAKGAVLLTGGTVSAILSAFGAQEAEEEIREAVTGETEEPPVLPSLMPAYKAGEGVAIGLSMLHAPYTLASKKPAKASEFLENFRNVATGTFANSIDDAAELTAKNAGLSEDMFQRANAARQSFDKFQQGTKFATGFNRFKPDPRKGPLGARLMDTIPKGIQKSLLDARTKPGGFLALEGLATTGISTGRYFAEQQNPGDTPTQLVYELAGSFFPPIAVQLAARYSMPLLRSLGRTANTLMSPEKTTQGFVGSAVDREAGERLYRALQTIDSLPENQPADPAVRMKALIEILLSDDPASDALQLTTANFTKIKGAPQAESLLQLEKILTQHSNDLKVAGDRGRDALITNAKEAVLRFAEQDDNPLALAIAGKLQQILFEEAISVQVGNRLDQFYKSAEKVLGADPKSGEARFDLSDRLASVLTPMLQQTKRTENELWRRLDDFVITRFTDSAGNEIDTPNIVRLFGTRNRDGGVIQPSEGSKVSFRRALGPFAKDLDELVDFYDPEKGPGFVASPKSVGLLEGADPREGLSPYTAERLWDVRSKLLARERQLREAGDPMQIELQKVNNALLQDLLGNPDQSAAYNQARSYTKARNEFWRNSFLGDITTRKNVDGDPAASSVIIDPDGLAQEFFKGGPLKTKTRIDEIHAAVKFGVDHGLDPKTFDRLATDEVMELLLRDSLRKVVKLVPTSQAQRNAIPGLEELMTADERFYVDPNALDTWRKQPGTEKLLETFPQLGKDMEDIRSIKNAFDFENQGLVKAAGSEEMKALQNIVGYSEAPARAIARAVSGPKPESALNFLVKAVKSAPEEFTDPETGMTFTRQQALGGLKSALLKFAFMELGGSGVRLNAKALNDTLFSPLKGTNLVLSEFMKKNGLIDPGHLEDIQRAIKQMRNVEEAFATGEVEKVLFTNPTPAKMLYSRILGATLGARAQDTLNNLISRIPFFGSSNTQQIGGGMVAAQEGSRVVANLLVNGPEVRLLQAQVNLFSDRKALGAMLKDISDKEDAELAFEAMEKAIAGTARQAGLRLPIIGEPVAEEGGEFIEEVFEPEPEPAPQPPPVSAVTELPTPRTAPAPMPAPTLAVAPQVTPPSQPVNRARFAAMFPNDPMSALIRQQSAQQGIGSLMG